MWVVIHMAKSLQLAQTINDLLIREGFLVRLHPVYKAVSDEENYYELKVPAAEAAEAQQVLVDQGMCSLH